LQLLAKHLSSCGYATNQASGDADTDIANVALQLTQWKQHPVAVAADDTDILALLLFHHQE
jgi:hypothetical protein